MTATLLVLVPGIRHECPASGPDVLAEPYKILFIGSSYFNGNDLPGLVKLLADSSGRELYIDRQITGGFYLDDHASSSATEAKINEEDWDFVILQGVGRITAYPETYTDHPVYPALQALRDKILANSESTKTVFCLPWAYEDGMTWLEGWTDTYEDMQRKIYENTLQYSRDLGIVVAPVGWAWNTVLKEMNYPLHYLHVSDWNHPSLRGSYLMACVIYSTVYLESSAGIDYHGGLSEPEASYFQEVASHTVLDSLELWNLALTDAGTVEGPVPDYFHLGQNHPNPFNPSTEITYFLPEAGRVTLRIFDVLGREVATPVSGRREAGSHTVEWSGDGYPGGIYFYRLVSGEFTETRKMVLLK